MIRIRVRRVTVAGYLRYPSHPDLHYPGKQRQWRIEFTPRANSVIPTFNNKPVAGTPQFTTRTTA